jgi:hypothetical protein
VLLGETPGLKRTLSVLTGSEAWALDSSRCYSYTAGMSIERLDGFSTFPHGFLKTMIVTRSAEKAERVDASDL